jgi:hypothetical protein
VGDAEVVEVVALEQRAVAGGGEAGDQAVDDRASPRTSRGRSWRAARTNARRVAIAALTARGPAASAVVSAAVSTASASSWRPASLSRLPRRRPSSAASGG